MIFVFLTFKQEFLFLMSDVFLQVIKVTYFESVLRKVHSKEKDQSYGV